jgi:hypothetical protein
MNLTTVTLEIVIPGREEPWRIDLLDAELLIEHSLPPREGETAGAAAAWLERLRDILRSRFNLELTTTQVWLFTEHVRDEFAALKKKRLSPLTCPSGTGSTPSNSTPFPSRPSTTTCPDSSPGDRSKPDESGSPSTPIP